MKQYEITLWVANRDTPRNRVTLEAHSGAEALYLAETVGFTPKDEQYEIKYHLCHENA